MELTPSQRARMAVLDHLLQEMTGGDFNTTINVKINIVSLTEHDNDWTAVVTTNAHTDRNYTVTYKANPGQTLVETFTRSSEVRYWDPQTETEPSAAPTTEYFGTP